MGRRLGTAEVRCIHDSADHRARRAHRRRRLQESRRPAGPHPDHDEGPRRHLAWEGVSLAPGDVVLVRTGTGRFWGDDGADHAKIAEHDSAGRRPGGHQVAGRGSGGDHGRLRHQRIRGQPAPDSPGTGIPVHRYLLVDQGVHLGEFHYLESLSKAKAYTFCYVAAVNKIKGTAAGFALRPLACDNRSRPEYGLSPENLLDYHDRQASEGISGPG